MSRTNKIYDKTPLSLDEMIALMESRNLMVPDKSAAFNLSPQTLDSWLHSLTYLRNRCAHHSQIYGRSLTFPPSLRPGWPALPEGAFSRYIAVLEYMLRKVAPDTGWGQKVKELIQGEPCVDPAALGISDHDFWEFEL